MPKDYRKRKKSRQTRSSSGSSNSFSWIVFGILIGLLIALVFYWKQVVVPKHQHHVAAAKTPASSQHAAVPKKAEKPATAAAPEFDFYTVLPKMEVSSNNTPAATAAPVRPPAASAAQPSTAPAKSASATPVPTTTTAPAASSPNAEVSLLPMPTEPGEKPAAPAPVAKTPTPKVSIAAAEAKVLAVPGASPAETKSAAPAAITEVKTPPTPSAAATSYLLQMGSLKSHADADRLKAELTMSGFDVHIQSYNNNGEVYNRVVMGPYSSKAAALQQQSALQKNGISSVLVKTAASK